MWLKIQLGTALLISDNTSGGKTIDQSLHYLLNLKYIFRVGGRLIVK